MSKVPKRNHPTEKTGLHPRNRHKLRYNFQELIVTSPELKKFVTLNAYQDESIDFKNPEAVKTLNRALLKHFYGIENWDIPKNYLCPPIPGRADYIHYIADLLGSCNNEVIPTGSSVRVLDIGVGANCVYPIIGKNEYGWHFVGSDIDPVAVKSATQIVNANTLLKDAVECRLQTSPADIFKGIIQADDHFDITICNPPFHSSLEEAMAGTQRKWKNLGATKNSKPVLNFGGQNNELWCKGGEEAFVRRMIEQSIAFADNCLWFSTLISKQSNLPGVYTTLKKVQAVDFKTIEMEQGQKVSRIVAWTFMNKGQQKDWFRKQKL